MKKQTLTLVLLGVVLFIAGGAIALVTVLNSNKHQTGSSTVTSVNTLAVVATTNIPTGTTGQDMVSQGLVAIQSIPQKQFQANDLTTLAALSDQVLTASVTKGHALLATQLIPSTTAVTLPQGMDAVTITMSGVQGLAGYLQPGSRADIYANITKLSTVPASQGNSIPIPCTQLTMSNIEVLDVSSTVPAYSTHPSTSGRTVPGSLTVMLAVTPTQSREITFMTLNETLSVVQTQKGTLPPVIGQCIGTGQTTDAP